MLLVKILFTIVAKMYHAKENSVKGFGNINDEISKILMKGTNKVRYILKFEAISSVT